MVSYYKFVCIFEEMKKIDGREDFSELWDGDFQYIFRDWWAGTIFVKASKIMY